MPTVHPGESLEESVARYEAEKAQEPLLDSEGDEDSSDEEEIEAALAAVDELEPLAADVRERLLQNGVGLSSGFGQLGAALANVKKK